jgi:hypothetical protein
MASAASAARADWSDNFDSLTWDGTTNGATWNVSNNAWVSTAHSVSGTQSLQVPAAETAIINIPGMSAGGVLTVEVFDQGNWTSWDGTNGTSSSNGYRVGITPSITGYTAGMAAILVDQRPWNGNAQGQNYSQGDGTPFGGFSSPYYDGYNPATGKYDSGTDRHVVSFSPTPNNGSLGVGEWTKWEFDFDAAGNVKYFYYDPTTGLPTSWYYTATMTNGAANSFFVYGGDTLNGGVYVDDVHFVQAAGVPEPASLSLLALAATPLLLRRRRA